MKAIALTVVMLACLISPASSQNAPQCRSYTMLMVQARAHGVTIERVTAAEVTALTRAFGPVPIEAWDEVWMETRDKESRLAFVKNDCLLLVTEVIPTRELYGYIGRLPV